MGIKHDRSFAKAESGVVDALEAAKGDEQAAVGAVADVLARDLKESGRRGAALLSAVSALADAVARGAADAGGEIGPAAEAFLIGVLLGTEESEERTLALISHAAGSFVKHAVEEGFDAAAASRGLVEGAAAWAGERGMDPALTATAAGQGAVDAAGDLGGTVAKRVRETLTTGLIAGHSLALTDPHAGPARA